MGNNFFTLAIILFNILLTIVYFSKKRVNSFETITYKYLVIINLIVSCLAIMSFFTIKYNASFQILNNIVSKSLLVAYLAWLLLFTIYLMGISNSKVLYGLNFVKSLIFRIAMIIFVIVISLCPLYYHNENNTIYSYGPAANVVFVVAAFMVLIWLIIIVLNAKEMCNKKYYPLYGILILGTIVMYVQYIRPELLLLTYLIGFITFLMYFTIENPDVKILNEMELAKSTALKANDAKNEFLSSMSHEIRTPMNNIKGCIEILNDDSSLSKGSKEVLDELNTSVDSLLDMSDGILNMVQLESGNMKVECKEYNPVDVLDDVTKLINKRIKSSKIEFVTNYKNIPDKVYGDKNKFKTILINLLNNAVKYTNNGKISMNVLAREDRDECFFTIQISDTGKGIEPNMKKKVFNKFVREKDVKNSSILGLGLGLTITKSLVELMHGNIVLRSEKGEGTYVLVMFPQYLRYVKSNKNDDIKKILMVDDRILTVSVDKMVLKSYGIDVDFVKSGVDAIEMVKNNNYDLILLYDEMNILDGIQTMKKLKFDYGFDKPIIAYTENLKNKDNLLESGFDDFIGKPINSDELYEKLSKYL